MRRALDLLLVPVGLLLLGSGIVRMALPRRRPSRPRLLFGTTPIKSLTYLSRALREAGYTSETAVLELYPIVTRDDFDHLVFSSSPSRAWRAVANRLLAYRFLAAALTRYDIFHYYFNGGLLRYTPLARLELPLLRTCRKKVVLIAFGSDSFVYDHIGDLLWRHALMLSYPALGNEAAAIERRLRRSVRHADIVVGSLFHVTCLPRWDVLPLTAYPVDTAALDPVPPRTDGPVRIAHASNHRGVKGTEFLIDAVDRLRAEGYEIELTLIEGRPNAEALALIADCDLYVDQLIAAYALAAIEAMALGKVVLSPIEQTPAYVLFRRYSYLAECPIVPATPETVADVLRELVGRRDEWPALGRAGRSFVERRHSFEAAQELWQAVYRRIWDGEEVDLINFYNPLHER